MASKSIINANINFNYLKLKEIILIYEIIFQFL